jgi:hypothetical protein
MKKLIKAFIILLLATMTKHVNAQLNMDNMPKKWGIETELIQPFIPNVGIVRFVATHTVYAPANDFKGDLLIGAYIRPNIKHDVVEKINEYMLILGYRQYFWKGLHAEARSNMGFAWGTKNLTDGKDYNNPTWFWEANAGYKFDFAKKQSTNLYAIAQFGILSKISADIGPRGGKSDTFLQGNLMVGINF